MEARKKLVLGTTAVAALATSALVAGLAFATPGNSGVTSVSPSAVQAKVGETAEPVEAKDVDNVQDENGADDATEAKGAEEAASAETDGIDHQFEGEEIGDNGNGVPDANEATETK